MTPTCPYAVVAEDKSIKTMRECTLTEAKKVMGSGTRVVYRQLCPEQCFNGPYTDCPTYRRLGEKKT